jgi:hypothetical protein
MNLSLVMEDDKVTITYVAQPISKWHLHLPLGQMDHCQQGGASYDHQWSYGMALQWIQVVLI